MKNLKDLINKLFQNRKISLGLISLALVLMLSILIPSLANFVKEDVYPETSIWDGGIASSYKSGSGTYNDPYLISTGAELAYFSYKLEETDYQDTYFKISNNIILNEGSLRYNPDIGIEYILDGNIYYVEYYTNKYYETPEKTGTEVGTINIFPGFKNFAGLLAGETHTIYGLYITDSSKTNLSTFEKVEGNISNLFFKNTLVYGGTTTSGLTSFASDATFTNVIFDGYVASKQEPNPEDISGDFTIDDINVQNYEVVNNLIIPELSNYSENFITAKISGNYEVIGEEATIYINDTLLTNNSFDISLEDLTNIQIKTYTSSILPVQISFSNLKYEITFNNSLVSGIIGCSKNTVIKSTVNLASVYGSHISSALVGEASESLEISQSYNRGNIQSDFLSSGLIGKLDDANITLENVFNIGFISAPTKFSLIGELGSNLVNIANSFDGTGIDLIPNIVDETIIVANSYTTNIENADSRFIYLSESELKNPDHLINNLNYQEYISDEELELNDLLIWSYQEDEFPVNNYDKILSKVIRLQVGNLGFKDYSSNVTNKIIKENITFSLEEIGVYDSIINKEIYISNEKTVLTKQQLNELEEWEVYDDINQINEEGNYIIYVKITNYKNEVSYLNSDILILDLTPPLLTLTSRINTWETFSEEPASVYIDDNLEIKITTSDNLSGIAYIKYLVSFDTYTLEDLSLLEDDAWLDYQDKILVSELGKQIVYAKVIDNAENVSYLNTSYLDYQGYNVEKTFIGIKENASYDNLPIHITNDSAFTFKASFEEETDLRENISHTLASSFLLPVGTEIKLLDNITNKAYRYKILTSDNDYNYSNSCHEEDLNCEKKASYPLGLFNEIGHEENTLYSENNYYNDGIQKEDFIIIVDFSDVLLAENYLGTKIYLEMYEDDSLIRSTIKNTLSSINIHHTLNEESAKAKISLMSDFDENEINLNTNSITKIDLTSSLNYQRYNEFKIIDTTYEYSKAGIKLKLVDINNNIIAKEYLKNVAFVVDGENYYIGKDNVLTITGNYFPDSTTKSLEIITYEGDSGLEEGIYYFKVSSFKSLGRYIAGTSDISDISIPVRVSKANYNKFYTLNMDSNVINKINEEAVVSFGLNKSDEQVLPQIRVSLYEKEVLSAYDQTYNLVDLQDYVIGDLSAIEEKSYLVSSGDDFNLKFIPQEFNNTGYQLIFQLYDGDLKMDTIKKYFIVK
ncbi:MAG: hypothetical protein PHX04_05150 [Bacilli bacterium]|nr:hypothetical protein [Bacilli bacterium]